MSNISSQSESQYCTVKLLKFVSRVIVKINIKQNLIFRDEIIYKFSLKLIVYYFLDVLKND